MPLIPDSLIPDSVRERLAPVVKYHFWLLVPLVPLLLVPAVFMAGGQLKTTIDRERATIDGHVASLGAIRREQDHPNDTWVQTFDRRAAAVRDELLREWQALWESQRPLRSWPAALGPDFLASIQAVESGTRPDLQFADLQRYMNTVPQLVRQLPLRMGCEPLMGDGEAGSGRRPPGGLVPGRDDDPEASLQLSPLEWRAEDQKRLSTTFQWDKAPSTMQVRLAQEELWVYGLLCDTIGRMNQGAKGAFDASITTVDELAVGYLAAEERPGGMGTGRIIGLRDAAAGSEIDDGLPRGRAWDGGQSDAASLQTRPPHPRFSGEAARPSAGDGEEDEEANRTPDDQFKQWIYVDFAGRPLTAEQLAAAPDARMVHLMPFLLRVTIDQRRVDRLLADLAANAIPIDVRQVRINPGAAAGSAGDKGDDSPGAGDRRRRSFDVTLELRGTVGLATPPNPAALGGGAPAANGGHGT